MKKVLLLTSVISCCLYMSGFAQVNTDSLAIVAKISEYRLKLGKLQNTINQKTNNKQNDSLHARQSAQANATAANNLNANAQDKSDARAADNAAGTARSDARKARKSGGKLDDANKEILYLQNQIAEEQLKLNKFTRMGYTPIGTATQPIIDSTRHP